MGKRIISQARGKGSLTYKVRKKAFKHRIKYPMQQGEAEIIDIIHSPAHSAPLLKMKVNKTLFYNPAFNSAFTGQKISLSQDEQPKQGDISPVKNIPLSSPIYNIELNPGDGGKIMRSAGTSAILSKKLENKKFAIQMPNKKEVIISGDCRATIGVIAGGGRTLKPFITAGKKYHKMKAKSKLWPRTSAVCMNAIDHPFGSGRGKRIKSKVAKRDAPPGRKVGHLRPQKTGKR
tara:strand:+ start:8485 stop:9183 length:699 start_codon:yes stop_codon:yes gene_type:complete